MTTERQSTAWRAATLLGAFLLSGQFLAIAGSAQSDFQLDESQRDPSQTELSTKAEKSADAMASFVTGVFDEENSGPEKALESYRKALELDPGHIELAIRVAYDYLRRGDSAEAIGVLKDAIKARPKDPDPALALASIYLRHLRKPDLAERYAQIALQSAPRAFAPYETLWEIAQTQGDSRRAGQVLDRALKSGSTDPGFWLQLAEFFASSKDKDAFADEKLAAKINTCLDRALAAAGNDADAIARVGDFYALNRQYAKSVPLYQKALGIRPSLPKLREKLADGLIKTGSPDQAIPVLEQVVKENPLDLGGYTALFELYKAKKEFAKAIGCLEQALIIEKRIWQNHVELGLLLLYGTREYAKAVERMAEARRLFPQIARFSYLQAVAMSKCGRHDEAMQTFERTIFEAANTEPDLLNSAFYAEYGAAAQEAARYVKAAELFKKAIELDPSNAAGAYNALGYMWVERNENLDEAEQLIRRAIEIDSTSGAIVDSLGWLYFKKGRYEEAVKELLRAAELLPEPDAVVYDHLGDAFSKLGRTAEAVLYWQKSVQLDPSNKETIAKVDRATERMAQRPSGN